ncbi:MAG: SpoIIE family protein phosphatase [Bacteroidales bacterium]|nr:SpoIIE family protein phosphatase [Bacteroidales bacterium]
MHNDFFIEIDARQINHQGQKICGDVFMKRRIKEENRFIVVLSDGMGHGVKANILASLTATMAMNFTIEHRDPGRIAEIIMKTLPVCKERKIAYATFTIIDVTTHDKVQIIEYDNPHVMAFRDGKPMQLDWHEIELSKYAQHDKKLFTTGFYPHLGDRLILVSDGVAQSGMGSETFPFGWGVDKITNYVAGLIEADHNISAARLSEKIVNRSVLNDGYKSKDDTSCASLYFREPRKLLLVTGPPFEASYDARLATIIREHSGKKVVCGGTTTDIVSRELGVEVTNSLDFYDKELPPVAYMPGIDLVTEGILTLNKVNRLLRDFDSDYLTGKGPADQIVKMFHESDRIDFVVGTKVNEAHQDPNVPVDLEIRRTIINRIARLLDEKFLKEVSISYL